MLNTASLSLEQAPPISIPFRFFLTAPLFGIAAGVLLISFGEQLFVSRWGAVTLALTHLFTLGILAMVMCGALMQMLPVIVGSPIPAVVQVGRFSHLLLTGGTIALVGAFISHQHIWMVAALVMLLSGFGLLIGAIGIALWRVKVVSPTVIGMRLALVSLLVTMLLGLYMGLRFSGLYSSSLPFDLTNVHLSWGIIGWIGLLLVGVSYQVVPMFQVTPEYPRWMQRLLIPGLFCGLLLWTLLVLGGAIWDWPEAWATVWLQLVVIGLPLFALATLRLQMRRKRRISDVTLLFWRSAMLSMLLLLLLWFAGQFSAELAAMPRYPILIGLLVLLGVAYPVINGMLYKIVPFLSWFHLQNRQLALMCMTVPVPNMKEFLPDRAARRQYYLYLGSFAAGLLAVAWPDWFARPAGVLFLLCNLLLTINLFGAVRTFRETYRQLQAASAG